MLRSEERGQQIPGGFEGARSTGIRSQDWQPDEGAATTIGAPRRPRSSKFSKLAWLDAKLSETQKPGCGDRCSSRVTDAPFYKRAPERCR